MHSPNSIDFDTIIVGARCAGAPLATLLARGGQKVLLLDSAKLPSDQPLSTHYIHAVGMDWLDELGVGAQIRALSPPSRVTRLQMLNTAIDVPYLDGRAGHCVRRSVLDGLLQDNARAAGAELRDQTEVVGLLRDADRICGVEVMHHGKRHTLRSNLVVGADGRDSTVASLAGAREYMGYDNVRFAYWGYWPTPPAWHSDGELAGFDSMLAFAKDQLLYFVFQCDQDLLVIGATAPLSQLSSWRGDHETEYLRALRRHAVIAKLVEGNQRVGKLVGLRKSRFFFRDAAGNGYALVGDAGLHKDPTPGLGITDAVRDARSLARASLDGSALALQRYHRQRDVDSFDLFHFAKTLGDPDYINPLSELVFERAQTRPDIRLRLAESTDRKRSPMTIFEPHDVLPWLGGALLRGRFSVLPPLLRSAWHDRGIELQRREVLARRRTLV